MTKRTRNLAIVASLAAAAVALDQLSGADEAAPSPSENAAASSQTATASGAAPLERTSPGAAGSPEEAAGHPQASPAVSRRVAERLLRHGMDPAEEDALPLDPFQPMPAPRRDPRVAERVAEPVQRVDVAAFLRRRPLAAVLGDGAQARAVVAGEVLRVGDVRDGMTVLGIERRHVVWGGEGLRFVAGLHAAGGAPIGRWAQGEESLPSAKEADQEDPVASLFDR